jgi:hypothetical protein
MVFNGLSEAYLLEPSGNRAIFKSPIVSGNRSMPNLRVKREEIMFHFHCKTMLDVAIMV